MYGVYRVGDRDTGDAWWYSVGNEGTPWEKEDHAGYGRRMHSRRLMSLDWVVVMLARNGEIAAGIWDGAKAKTRGAHGLVFPTQVQSQFMPLSFSKHTTCHSTTHSRSRGLECPLAPAT